MKEETRARTLTSGRTVPESAVEVDLKIGTKCPAKWLFVDLETGDIWHREELYGRGVWKRASAVEMKELRALVNKEAGT